VKCPICLPVYWYSGGFFIEYRPSSCEIVFLLATSIGLYIKWSMLLLLDLDRLEVVELVSDNAFSSRRNQTWYLVLYLVTKTTFKI